MTIYRCLGCSKILQPAELIICFEDHLERFYEAVPMGCFCEECMACHRLSWEVMTGAEHAREGMN